MKDKLPGQINTGEGFSTVELLIALAIFVLTISGVIIAIFGSQSVVADSQTSTEALHKAQQQLDAALETSRSSFDTVVNTSGSYVNGITYTTALDIPPTQVTQCSKQVTSRVTWTGDHSRPEKVELTTTLTNVPLMLSLGGACDTNPPSHTS
jgi:type II secretory pathway pseudopilin PulG